MRISDWSSDVCSSDLVLTGAGISAESGVPTFRDSDGLWEGHNVEDVATPEAYEHRPSFVQKFYDERRAFLSKVEPNAAHVALGRLSELIGRSEEHTSELQSLMRISYAVFCLKKKTITLKTIYNTQTDGLYDQKRTNRL